MKEQKQNQNNKTHSLQIRYCSINLVLRGQISYRLFLSSFVLFHSLLGLLSLGTPIYKLELWGCGVDFHIEKVVFLFSRSISRG